MKKTISALIIGLVCATNATLANAEDLLSVYKQAQSSDPTVLRSRALFNASKEGIEQARAILLPQFNASASYTESQGDREGNKISESESTMVGISFSMQLYHHSSWLRLDNAKKVAHQSDVAYQAGVDSHGNTVAPADLAGSQMQFDLLCILNAILNNLSVT